MSKTGLISHIKEKHGQEVCHKFLLNECERSSTDCIFSHQEPRTEGFPSLHTTGPVVWSQLVGHSPQTPAPALPNMSQQIQSQMANLESQVIIAFKQIMPQMITHIMEAMRIQQ